MTTYRITYEDGHEETLLTYRRLHCDRVMNSVGQR